MAVKPKVIHRCLPRMSLPATMGFSMKVPNQDGGGMAWTVTIAQQKGGAGKTTLAAHLAVAFAGDGARKVAVVDIDPQGSLSRWYTRRTDGIGGETVPKAALTFSQITGWRTQAEVDRLKQDHDLVLIDSPPHMETEAKIAIRAADLVLVPVQPSPMDLWATQPTLDMAAAEKRRAMLVINRMPPRGRLADSVRAEIDGMGVPVAPITIGNRTGLAASLLEGRGITETGPRTSAGKEIADLANTVLTHLSR